MSNWTKGLFIIALGLQVFFFIMLNDYKFGEVYYINSAEMFLLMLCSATSILYTVAGFISYNQDKQFKELHDKL